ncbi:hypothetical protein GCM10011315_23090 [Roseovarius pacificus]|nr:hypothetical protein GCM10011315_23090 [Roseovarius pacificus]
MRDHLLILMMFRHGLRVSEAIALRRSDVDLAQSRVWIARLKNGLSVEQPVPGDELRPIRRWLAKRDDALTWLFISERKQPLTRQAVNYIVSSVGNAVRLDVRFGEAAPQPRRGPRMAAAGRSNYFMQYISKLYLVVSYLR